MGRAVKRALRGWPLRSWPLRSWPLRSWPLAAAAAALAVHGLIVFLVDVPGVFSKYPRAAAHQLAGELPEERLMDLSPLYFELAVAATRLAPEHPEHLLRALQVVLVAVAAGFLAALLDRRVGRAVAVLGWLAFIGDRHVLVYERILEPEACLLFFVVGCLFFVDRGRGGAFAAGFFAAASLLTRPTFLPLYALVPLYLRLRGASWVRRSALFAAPVAAALALLMLRAAAVTGDPRTPVMNPGTVFFEGNNALSHGTSAIYPPVVRELIGVAEERPDVAHEHYRAVARAAAGEELSIARVNAYWSGLAAAAVRDTPRRHLGLLLEKLQRAFNGYRWHDITLAWRYDRALRLPSVPFALLSALALLGMAFEARRWRPAMLYYALAGLQLAVMLVFYVSARQRLVWLPALLYFAAVALEELRSGRRRRGRRRLLVTVVLLLALCFALPNDQTRDDHYVKTGYVEAQTRFQALSAAARQEPLAAHAGLALDALRHAPWVDWVPAYFPQVGRSADERLAELLAAAPGAGASAAFDRAVVFLRAGRLDEAATLLGELAAAEREVYRGAQQPSQPRFYLARIAALAGDRDGAVRRLEEALDRSPGNPFVLAELWVMTGDPGHRERLLRLQGTIDARYLAGRSLFFHGRFAEAVAELDAVVDRLPEFRTGRIYLAAALGAAGHVDEGAAHYLEAVRREPDPLLLSGPISELFRRWAALHDEDPQRRLIAAHVLHEHGRFPEALALLEGIEAPPGSLRRAADEEMRRLRLALRALSPAPGGT